ncbi:MAG: glycosyltransferase [Clostridia bacterium]|nr:glycosyltransferase [Clostridia bacterium]
MPKYSIIVPVYKAEAYLSECVESVLSQAFSDFELILVDDGSPDGSGDLCDRYAERDGRVRVIHKENGGVSSARNAGVDVSEGEYIIFLDSDDFVDKTYFDVIEELVSSGGELFSFGTYNYDHKIDGSVEIMSSGMNLDIELDTSDSEGLSRFMLDGFFAPPWNKVFLASVIKANNLRFPLGVVCFEDYLFSLEYLRHVKKIKSTSAPIYYYRGFEAINHVSKRRWGERFVVSRLVYSHTEDFIKSKGLAPELLNLHRYTWSAYIAELRAARTQDADAGMSAIKKSLREAGFCRAVRVITPRGKFFRALSLLIRLRLYGIASKMIKKRI